MSLPHLGLMLLINLLWGFNFVALKWTMVELPPVWAACFRFILVAVICLPWLKFRIATFRPTVFLATLAAFHFALGNAAIAFAQSASAIAIATQLSVPISTLFAVVFLKETIGWKRITGIILAFLGVVVLKWNGADQGENTLALTMMLLASIFYGLSAINMRRLRGVTPLELQAWTGIVCAIVLCFSALAIEGNPLPLVRNVSIFSWGGIVYSAVASSVFGHAANFYLLQRYPVSMVAPYTLLVPVIAVIAGIFVLDDPITFGLILGGILTMAGVGIITFRGMRKAEEHSAQQ